MRKTLVLSFVILGFLSVSHLSVFAQLTEKELAERSKWEQFMAEAAVLKGSQPLPKRLAVTKPHHLRLGKDGEECWAWWKNVSGRPDGYPDYWRREIAAYEIDKFLCLNMIPPTVERRYKDKRGAVSLEMEGTVFRELKEAGTSIPSAADQRTNFFRALYLRTAWDNLVANEVRSEGDMIITDDWRMYLIDHSRAFSSTKKLILLPDKKSTKEPIQALPAVFVERLALLDYESITNVVGEYLTKKEIERLLLRKDKLLAEVERLKAKYPNFLY